jgi:GH24 family phage-related lysozyme (muramidase)
MPTVTPSQKRTAIAASAVVAFATPFEAIRQVAYYDPPGILTVCEGHTGADVQKDKVYTLGECHTLAVKDATRAVQAVDRCAPGAPDSVLEAYADAVFNLGETIACDQRHSTAARLLYVKNWRGACEQLPLWNKAHIAGVLVTLPGLTRRRKAERDLCLKDLT